MNAARWQAILASARRANPGREETLEDVQGPDDVDDVLEQQGLRKARFRPDESVYEPHRVVLVADREIRATPIEPVQINARYEYTTREFRYVPGTFPTDHALEANGWVRAWSDTTMEGVFVVYRRTKIRPAVE